MKITDVRIRLVKGNLPPDMPVYDAAKGAKVRYLPADNHYMANIASDRIGAAVVADAQGQRVLEEAFLYIDTDEGIVWIAGPINNTDLIAPILMSRFRGVLIGADPLNTERLWDILYRKDPFNYAGVNMVAISLCDMALWDIKCKKAGLPLWQMIGGATQSALEAYANCTGLAYNEDSSGYDLGKVAELTGWCTANGFAGAKWYPHRGPANGKKGLDELYEMFSVIRSTAGADFKLMIDVWSAWDVDYTLRAASRLAPLDIYWIEEPVMPNQPEAYAKLRRESPIPISAGENLCTRWAIKQYLDMEALDIYQPDPAWCGGISETIKIMSLIAMYDKRVCLHGYCVPIAAQLTAAYTANICPVSEFLLAITPGRQYFYQHPLLAEQGLLHLPSEQNAGIGLDIDESKVIESRFI